MVKGNSCGWILIIVSMQKRDKLVTLVLQIIAHP